ACLRARRRGPNPARRPDDRLRLDGGPGDQVRSFKRILVAGGAGFLGSNFVRFLKKNRPQLHVTVLDDMTYASSRDTLKDLTGVQLIEGDIRNASRVDMVASEVDAIVNFAAHTHVDRSLMDPT